MVQFCSYRVLPSCHDLSSVIADTEFHGDGKMTRDSSSGKLCSAVEKLPSNSGYPLLLCGVILQGVQYCGMFPHVKAVSLGAMA